MTSSGCAFSELPTGWFTYPINDADQPPARAWNDPSWSPPPDNDPDPVMTVKLMPEYSVELPLWGAEWWQLGLTPALLDALADWQEQFDTHFEPGGDWTDHDVAAQWQQRASELADALARELPADVILKVDLWPIRSRRHRRRIEQQDRRHRST